MVTANCSYHVLWSHTTKSSEVQREKDSEDKLIWAQKTLKSKQVVFILRISHERPGGCLHRELQSMNFLERLNQLFASHVSLISGGEKRSSKGESLHCCLQLRDFSHTGTQVAPFKSRAYWHPLGFSSSTFVKLKINKENRSVWPKQQARQCSLPTWQQSCGIYSRALPHV